MFIDGILPKINDGVQGVEPGPSLSLRVSF